MSGHWLRDDVTGDLTLSPGIESDRELYAATDHWEGVDMPSHPDAPPLDAQEDPALAWKRRDRERFWANFQSAMAV